MEPHFISDQSRINLTGRGGVSRRVIAYTGLPGLLRYQDRTVLRHFGTCLELSGHFGTSTNQSGQSAHLTKCAARLENAHLIKVLTMTLTLTPTQTVTITLTQP